MRPRLQTLRVSATLLKSTGPVVALVALCFAAAGFTGVQPLFWTFLTGHFGSIAAAGGLVASNMKAWADLGFGSSYAGLCVLACTTLIGVALKS